ncbi:hypothetical protein JK364_49625 [Streptomyces sp. 110]|uniref:Uncharacterized protein n=1 Tax=Streptomyces endocoffeicus TaxID=2898945 RepID=A0ABS1Q7G9_9ACTN|nr:hypothetical protein [Streptomyces endocoffeicus]MBL1120300.1 hypothetical protein [Streptomyces endocoffeicus]
MPEEIGEHALGVLGAQSGAVIKDRCNTLYWLIVPGAAATWNLYCVHVLGAVEGVATYLGVPPVDRLAPPGSHWRVPFTRDGYLTDPRLRTRRGLPVLPDAQRQVRDRGATVARLRGGHAAGPAGGSQVRHHRRAVPRHHNRWEKTLTTPSDRDAFPLSACVRSFGSKATATAERIMSTVAVQYRGY